MHFFQHILREILELIRGKKRCNTISLYKFFLYVFCKTVLFSVKINFIYLNLLTLSKLCLSIWIRFCLFLLFPLRNVITCSVLDLLTCNIMQISQRTLTLPWDDRFNVYLTGTDISSLSQALGHLWSNGEVCHFLRPLSNISFAEDWFEAEYLYPGP